MGQPDEDFAPGDHLSPDERDPEAPAEDAVEQATVADPNTEDQPAVQRGLEVDEWDALEQARVVGPQDDDYR
ncbi:hypothetical protein GCM10022225_28650 [Plantactinospora mayteni]|uniref:DUF5709 domain-containing protein n=1 Tax=Plantactinospora mayteni TaxID=566021 RepID=A0ABQ4ET93_9ACTN|nr:hypothetical protein [Plantactinospora mayteni]GIG97871.1 hypothetical protein Pma05_44440 [Plantactinospora mayteni]